MSEGKNYCVWKKMYAVREIDGKKLFVCFCENWKWWKGNARASGSGWNVCCLHENPQNGQLTGHVKRSQQSLLQYDTTNSRNVSEIQRRLKIETEKKKKTWTGD